MKSVTLNPAQIFGLADQFGTIEPGKTANLIVTTGDPLELQTDVRYLFIKGQLTSTDNKHANSTRNTASARSALHAGTLLKVVEVSTAIELLNGDEQWAMLPSCSV